MSDEPSEGRRRATPGLPPPPDVKAKDGEDLSNSEANARAVGVDTAFLEALGDEFADTPASSSRYGKGGTLVVESTRERDKVVTREFLDDSTPTLQLEGKDAPEGPLLFETAAASSASHKSLGLASGAANAAGDSGDGLPDVLAGFDANEGVQEAEESGDAMIVSVAATGPEIGEPPADEPEPKLEPEPEPVKTAPAAMGGTTQADSKRAGGSAKTAAKPDVPVAARSASEDQPEHRKYAWWAVVALLLIVVGIAMTRGNGPVEDKPAARAASPSDAAGPHPAEAEPTGETPNASPSGAAATDSGVRADQSAMGGAADDSGADGSGADGSGAADSEATDSEATDSGTADSGTADSGPTSGGDGAGTTVGEPELVIVEGDRPRALPGGGGSKKQEDRRAEDDMDAKTLREAARKAITQRRYADGYRLASKAQRKQPGEPAAALRVESACGLKNKGAAKSALQSVKTLKRRRELRSRCRDLGTRLGL